jgi:hypothetical protein
MASYLEPNLSDYEIIEAVRCHYPADIQKLLVTTRMNTVVEALEVLRRLEILEETTTNFRAEVKQDHAQQNSFPNRTRNEGQRGAGPVRQVQRYTNRDRGNWDILGAEKDIEEDISKEVGVKSQNVHQKTTGTTNSWNVRGVLGVDSRTS